jgi:hypothetical protein
LGKKKGGAQFVVASQKKKGKRKEKKDRMKMRKYRKYLLLTSSK